MLNWNETRIDLLSRLLIALLKIKTVNLAGLARAFISKAEESSRYRRIQRFLKDYELDEEQRARMTMQLMEPENINRRLEPMAFWQANHKYPRVSRTVWRSRCATLMASHGPTWQ